MMNLHIEIQQLIKIKSFDSADGHAHGVAEVVADVMVLKKARMLGKNRTLGWVFDVTFERHQPLAASFVEQFIHHFERVEITLFGEFRSSENPCEASRDLF